MPRSFLVKKAPSSKIEWTQCGTGCGNPQSNNSQSEFVSLEYVEHVSIYLLLANKRPPIIHPGHWRVFDIVSFDFLFLVTCPIDSADQWPHSKLFTSYSLLSYRPVGSRQCYDHVTATCADGYYASYSSQNALCIVMLGLNITGKWS